MKTHPDSIWIDYSSVGYARVRGATSGTLYTEKPHDNGVEFVPESALTELTARLEKAEYSANAFESLYESAYQETEALKDQLREQTEVMLKLRKFVERIANDELDEHGEPLMLAAQDLMLEVTR
jgi:hypothetical protein